MCGRCIVACPAHARFSAEDGFIMFVGGRGRGYRWMYLQTGLPEWARYGYPAMPWSHRCMHLPWMPWTYPGFRAPIKEDELSALRKEAVLMEEELTEIKKRIQELGG
jgi:hypothetical protein